MRNIEQLYTNTLVTPVCAGVDPDLNKILQYEIFSNSKHGKSEDTLYRYLQLYIKAVAPHISAFKVQKAFFDMYSGGHDLLAQVVKDIHHEHPDLPVILDCKIGDIDNTMSAYVENVFGKLDCDGVVVNPYMGGDVVKELSGLKDKIICVLCKTSNESGGVIQDELLANGDPVWMHVLKLSMNDWNQGGNIVPVISSVKDKQLLKNARLLIPERTPILFAGVGAQGRQQSDADYLLNSSGKGVFVNSSRGLMYPDVAHGQNLEDQISNAVLTLKKSLHMTDNKNDQSEGYFFILAGVSGVGKTTIIKELQKIDPRFTYVSPEVTRDLRDGEKDKLHVSREELERKKAEDKYLVVNELNGVAYATPKDTITQNFAENRFSVLDFPIDRTQVIADFVGKKVFVAYVAPPSLDALKERLSYDGRDPEGKRYNSAVNELQAYGEHLYDPKIDIHVVSEDGQSAEIAKRIYAAFMEKRKKDSPSCQ